MIAGDITPSTDAERWVSAFVSIIGASIYAYIIGVASGIVGVMNGNKLDLQETVDELNAVRRPQWSVTDGCCWLTVHGPREAASGNIYPYQRVYDILEQDDWAAYKIYCTDGCVFHSSESCF